MKRLIYSLLFLVLIASIGSGWVLDGIYTEYVKHKKTTISFSRESNTDISMSDGLSVLKGIGNDLAKFLDAQSNPKETLLSWPLKNNFNVLLEAIDYTSLPETLKSMVFLGEPLVLERHNGLSLYFFLKNSNQILILDSPYPANKSENILNIVFTIIFYALLIGLMLLWSYPLIRQLVRLQASAKKLGHGELSVRVISSRFSYIKDIEKSFNRMAAQIETQMNDIKLLSSAVSHDLRTPLARIRFGLDTLSEESDPKLREKYQEKISDNVDEMVNLVDVLLKYTRMDQNLLKINFSSVNLNSVIKTCVDKVSNPAIKIISSTDSIYVLGIEAYLKMLTNNLMGNAIKYGHQRIHIYLSLIGDYVELRVEDDGAGIPEALRDDVIKPFIRGKHNTQGIKGYGFGLAIVQRIVNLHKGQLSIEASQHLGGACMKVTLPVPERFGYIL